VLTQNRRSTDGTYRMEIRTPGIPVAAGKIMAGLPPCVPYMYNTVFRPRSGSGMSTRNLPFPSSRYLRAEIKRALGDPRSFRRHKSIDNLRDRNGLPRRSVARNETLVRLRMPLLNLASALIR
jgi:hypothetical protein